MDTENFVHRQTDPAVRGKDPVRPLLASELYAISQGKSCSGREECYWCSAPCGRFNTHDDDVPVFAPRRAKTQAKRPGNAFVCDGCWLWRRKRITVFWLSEGFKDGLCPLDHSWWITDQEAWGIRVPKDAGELYARLLEPPLLFTLTLTDGTPGAKNHIQHAFANDLEEIKADTPLKFTLNNIPHEYTVYELGNALRTNDPAGMRPGVGALLRLFGPYEASDRTERRGPGRPRSDASQPHKKTVTKSGP